MVRVLLVLPHVGTRPAHMRPFAHGDGIQIISRDPRFGRSRLPRAIAGYSYLLQFTHNPCQTVCKASSSS